MFQKQACDSRLDRCVRRKENEDFLFNLSVNVNSLISSQVDEFSSDIDESEKFTIIKSESKEVGTAPITISISPRPVDTESSIIVATVVENVQVIELKMIIIFESEVENDVPYCYPFVTLERIQGYSLDAHS